MELGPEISYNSTYQRTSLKVKSFEKDKIALGWRQFLLLSTQGASFLLYKTQDNYQQTIQRASRAESMKSKSFWTPFWNTILLQLVTISKNFSSKITTRNLANLKPENFPSPPKRTLTLLRPHQANLISKYLKRSIKQSSKHPK